MSKKYWYKKKKVERAYRQGCEIQVKQINSNDAWVRADSPAFNYLVFEYRAVKPKFKVGEVYKTKSGEGRLIVVTRKEKVAYQVIAVDPLKSYSVYTYTIAGKHYYGDTCSDNNDLIWESK